MALITRTYTFTDGQTAYGSQVDSEIANIVNTVNSLNAGTTTWTNVKLVTLTPTADLDFSSYRLKNVGTPTTSGDAAKYPVGNSQLSAGTALANLASNSITQLVTTTSSFGAGIQSTTVCSRSITTTGGTVLVLACADINNGTGIIYSLDRDGSLLYRGGNTGVVNQLITVIFAETPAAGTYTYTLKYNSSSGTVTDSNIIIIELKR